MDDFVLLKLVLFAVRQQHHKPTVDLSPHVNSGQVFQLQDFPKHIELLEQVGFAKDHKVQASTAHGVNADSEEVDQTLIEDVQESVETILDEADKDREMSRQRKATGTAKSQLEQRLDGIEKKFSKLLDTAQARPVARTTGVNTRSNKRRPDLAAAGRRRSLCGQLGRQLFWCPGAAAAANRIVRRLPGQRKRHGRRHARHTPGRNL